MTKPQSRITTHGPCPLCGKVRYESRDDAKRVIRLRSYQDCHAYQCSSWWHIGHRPPLLTHGAVARATLGPAARRQP